MCGICLKAQIYITESDEGCRLFISRARGNQYIISNKAVNTCPINAL